MTPQPLSKERKDRIVLAFNGRPDSVDARLNYAVETITELLADSEYWRNEVKNATLASDGSVQYCVFCKAHDFDGPLQHKEDCAVLRAQE